MIKTKWVKIHPRWKPAKDKFRSDYHYGYSVKYGWRNYTYNHKDRTGYPVLKVGEEYALTVIMDKKLRVNQCLD